MKIKMLFTLSLMFLGMLSIKAQPPGGGVGVAVAADQTVKPHDDFAPCATIINFKQECDDQGNVTVTFNVKNNTNLDVTSLWVYLDGPITITSIPVNMPPGGVSPTITYAVPSAPSIVCFNVRLFAKGEECCRIRRCYRIDECPCGEVEVDTITCVPGETDVYELCLTVTNPAYSTSIVDVIMMTSNYPDLCINGMPSPAPIVLSTPLAIGSSTTVCVTIEGCNSSIPSGEIIGITPHLLNSNSSYCCEPGAFRFRTPNCCDLSSSETTTNATCTLDAAGNPVFASDGTATITVTNGTGPYTGTYSGPSNGTINSNSGTININGLVAGTYTYSITDADGCPIDGSFTVVQGACPCNINASPSGGNGGWNGTFNSFGAGFLCIDFFTQGVPDQIIITVTSPNGTVTTFDSGPWSSNLTTAAANANYPACNGTVTGGVTASGGNGPSNYTPSIPIGAGDVITIQVIGGVCGGSTFWALNASCQATPCGTTPTPGPFPTDAQKAHGQQVENGTVGQDGSNDAKRLSQGATSGSLKVFPNPVQDVLTIQNTDTEVSYELVNILDSSGRIISTENMSGNADIRVDVSSLPRGMYFIDAMDSNGNKVTERFIKIK